MGGIRQLRADSAEESQNSEDAETAETAETLKRNANTRGREPRGIGDDADGFVTFVSQE